ncbi:MAG: amidohydrolase [bacterium]|nr:amidohydrolase [bacterium]
MDSDDRRVDAVGVSGDRIAALGSLDEVREHATPETREIDLADRTLIPGFIDSHSHLAMAGDVELRNANLNSPPIGDVKTMDELVERLRNRADHTPQDDWILGMGYDDTLLAEKTHPTRRDLDRVSTTRPVIARHVSGHIAAANGRALNLCGITRDTPDPVGGVIRREASGEPNGVLEESAMFALMGKLPQTSEEQAIRAIEHAARSYSARGVTTAQNGFTSSRELQHFDAAFSSGRVPIRVVAWPGLGTMGRLVNGSLKLETPDEFLTVGAIKLFADGSIQGYTGHLSQPYHVPFNDQPEYRGYAMVPREMLADQIAQIYAAGYQVAVHTNGDAAIDDFLHGVEKANAAYPRPDARPIAVHAQMSREDQLEKMRELGVVPSFFCLHTYYWGDRHRDIFLGPDRASRISPLRSAAKLGIRFTIHTDSPVVPMDQLLLMWSAVNRRTTSGRILGEEQCLTPLEALRATTIDSAWQMHLEQSRGSIEIGKLADFAVLDRNPLDDPEAIREIQVEATIVAGRELSS